MLTSKEATRGFAAIGSKPRLDMLRVLIRAGPKGLTVGQIQARMGLPASTLAHHLRLLAASGLIVQKRYSRTVVNQAAFRHIKALASYLMEECCLDDEADQLGCFETA